MTFLIKALRLASPPDSSRASATDILRGALEEHIKGYERPSGGDEGLDPAKRLHAGRLVAGELRIWKAALCELDSLAGGEATNRGAKKQAKWKERAPLEPWEVAAAVCASRKRRRD